MSKNCLEVIQHTVECAGNGENVQDAVENAFQQMRISVKSEFEKPIISINTEKIECLEFKSLEKEEAFLHFFLKRKKEIYNVNLRIYLEIKYLNIGGESHD